MGTGDKSAVCLCPTNYWHTMRSFLILSCLVAAVLAQQSRPSWWQNLQNGINAQDDVIDRIHDFRIEYHHNRRQQHLLIAISDERTHKECHFIEISPTWEPLLRDDKKVELISEEIYQLISDPSTPETTLTTKQLADAYHDGDATHECYRHTVKLLSYTPSAAVQG